MPRIKVIDSFEIDPSQDKEAQITSQKAEFTRHVPEEPFRVMRDGSIVENPDFQGERPERGAKK